MPEVEIVVTPDSVGGRCGEAARAGAGMKPVKTALEAADKTVRHFAKVDKGMRNLTIAFWVVVAGAVISIVGAILQLLGRFLD